LWYLFVDIFLQTQVNRLIWPYVNLVDVRVILFVRLSNIVDALANNDLGHANELLPQMMAHPAWNFNPEILWQISLKAYKNRLQWLEVLQSTPETKPFANWLISCARASKGLEFVQ
jgi:hypothetical protein